MEQRQMWIATAAVMLTVILSVTGATWWVGRNIATREDVAQIRNEITAEIRVGRESADAQMEELRGYIFQHLAQHNPDGQ